MAPPIKKWLMLPFIGSSISIRDREHHTHDHGASSKRSHPDQEGVLSKHETAADYAKKGEDEIIQDYNAPIHWCDRT